MTLSRDAILKQAQFLSFFSTPTYVVRLPQAAQINPALKTLILAKAEAETDGLMNSNVGGWHSGRDLLHWGGEPMRTLARAAIDCANRLTMDRKGQPQTPSWQISCWANVNHRGHANRRHSHPGCFWSGTYYVDDGSDTAGTDVAGQFELHDPRGVAAAVTPAQLAAGARRLSADQTLIRPQTGMMVLFPAWMPHSVRPYRGDRVRISVAFNLAYDKRG